MTSTQAIRKAASAVVREGAVRFVVYADFSGDHCMGRAGIIDWSGGEIRDEIITPTYIREIGHAEYLSCMQECARLVHVGLPGGRWRMIEIASPDPAVIEKQMRNICGKY